MTFQFRHNYDDYTDRELVDIAIRPQEGKKPNEEGIAFLLYKRYDPLLHTLYFDIYEKRRDLYGDCVDDLFEYLKSGNPTWRKLINMEWRSSFGTWLRITARNRFIEIKPTLIGKLPKPLSIDDTTRENPVQLPEGGVEDYEDKERKVLLMEAISLLKDEDQKFVIIKRLKGYNSKEIAVLLQKRWKKHGIVKYNNKKQLVIPDAAYVDVRTQRAKDNLEIIMKKLM